MSQLPNSGPLSLQQIQQVFGGPAANINLTSYYRGGGLVPNTPANSNIPTSGPIDVLDFYGASTVLLQANFTTTTIESTISSINFSSFSFRTNGTVYSEHSTIPDEELGTFLNPTGANAATGFEIRAVRTGGNAPVYAPSSDALNVFLPLTQERRWTVRDTTTVTAQTVILTITIRSIANPTDQIIIQNCIMSADLRAAGGGNGGGLPND